MSKEKEIPAAPATGVTAELTPAEVTARTFAAAIKSLTDVLPNSGKKSKVLWYLGEAQKLALQAAGG